MKHVSNLNFIPANYCKENKKQQEPTNLYLHGITSRTLHPYNQAFRRNNTQKEIDCRLLTCADPGTTKPQLFLPDEGGRRCEECEALLCVTLQLYGFNNIAIKEDKKC